MCECMHVQAFSTLEPKGLVGWGRANIHSMCRKGRKTMVMASDQSVAPGTCHVRSRKPLQKSVDSGAGLTSGRIGLKLCTTIATKGGQNPSGTRWCCPLGLPPKSKLVARSRRGKRRSSRLYERKTIRSVALSFV